MQRLGRASGSVQGRVPALVLGGEKEVAVAPDWLSGADDYLPEPWQPALVVARVLNLLEMKRVRQQAASLAGRLKKLTHDLTEVILPVGIALSAEKDSDRLLERIVLEAKAICNADGGTLYLRTKDDHLKFAIMHTDSLSIALGGTTGRDVPFPPLALYDEKTGQPNHHNVATHVALQGESVNIADVYHAEGFDFSATQQFDRNNGYRTISCLTVPLEDNDGQVIGVLQVLNRQDPVAGGVTLFDSYVQMVTESLASQAAVALTNHMLVERERELIKFERDVQIGRRMQADFLPAELPRLSAWDLAAYFQPAREVSGDFYDVFHLHDGERLALVIADVCDKGVGAALFMTLIRSLIRAFSDQQYSLRSVESALECAAKEGGVGAATAQGEDVLAAVALKNSVLETNNYVAINHSRMNMFATMFFGVLDPRSGKLLYVNGGHEAPVLLGSQGVKGRLKPTGPAVGMMADMPFEVGEVQLDAGDLLIAYTDGVTEARSPTREFFAEPRLLSLLQAQPPGISAGACVEAVNAALRAHIATADQFDDITMLAIARLPAS